MFRMIRERRIATCLTVIVGVILPVPAQEPVVVVTRLSDLESAEDHAGHIIDVSELDTFNLEYPAFDMLENGEWGGDFDLEER